MALPLDVEALEQDYISPRGRPTLGRAYERLLEEWRGGNRDREVVLHLMFLSWYLLCEPPFLTGIDAERVDTEEFLGVFREAHDFMRPAIEGDAEALYAIGLMAHLLPHFWPTLNRSEWDSMANDYRVRYRALCPQGMSPSVFTSRGAYGKYFEHQASSGHKDRF